MEEGEYKIYSTMHEEHQKPSHHRRKISNFESFINPLNKEQDMPFSISQSNIMTTTKHTRNYDSCDLTSIVIQNLTNINDDDVDGKLI